MKKIHLTFLSILCLSIILSSTISAQTLMAGWTFDDTPPAPNTPILVPATLGTQTGTAYIYADGTNGSSIWNQATELAAFTGTTLNDPRGVGALAGFSYDPVNSSANGKSMILKFSMNGYENLILSFATRGTATGFNSQQWAWSTDGANFTNIGSNTAITTSTWTLQTIDFTSVSSINNESNVYLRITFDGASTSAGNNRLDNVQLNASTIGVNPTLTVSPTSLSGFSYVPNSGPSESISYDLSGTNLTGFPGVIAISGSTNYEVSLNNSAFGSNVNVAYTSSTLSLTPIYVRLKAGLSLGEFNGELIVNSGGGATTQNVLCNGAVVLPEPTNYVTGFTGILGNPTYYFNNISWIDATGGTIPDGYLIKRSYVDFNDIFDPVDGIVETNSTSRQNVAQGGQATIFTGFAGSTYFYKIFPFTNSGSFIDYKTDGSVPQFSITNANAPSLPITENFEYTTGSLLTDNGWVAHSGAGNFPIQVKASPLSYSGYINSDIGKSVTLIAPGTSSAEDVNRAFDSTSVNSVYASFMVNIESATTSLVYFFHLGRENTTEFYARVFVQNDGADNLAFGLAKQTNAAILTPFVYSLNTTYLIVVKYTFNTGTTFDDEVKLWINPVLDGTEPPADLTQTDETIDDITSLGLFALRQGSNGPGLTLGGIRVANNWIPGSAPTTFPLSVSVNNGWNMVSTPGLHPTNQNVTTWWSGKDPAAGVFRFSGGYLPVTTTTPGQGYWMKHVGAKIYNTGDEWPVGGIQIVPNAPIAGATGWNLIGGYELSVLTANITTTPGGLRTGQVFGYSGGYTPATNLVPGYAYWIKLTAPGSINIPTSLAKGLAKTTEVNTSDWGKIIITDNSGISYTLYTVKGDSPNGAAGVNLNDFELPPAPPTGMFDVRYGSGRYAEELSAVNQTIELNSLEYPVKVRVENADIRLQDGTGNGLNERLKSGEEVTISNSAINKLMVSGDVIPATYSLDQNYPNPFNPSTKIEFSIPEDVNNVTLTIYNALGQRVAELVNSKMEAGKYSYVWNASDVSTGLYIYELRTDKFVSVKKMMLLK